MVTDSTEAWLMTLRKNLAEVEADTGEAFESRRELAKLLVEKITVSRDEEGRPKVEITYRFGPPKAPLGEDNAHSVQNSSLCTQFWNASLSRHRVGRALR